MSKLYGQLSNERGTAKTVAGARAVEAFVQTEFARLIVELDADGDVRVKIASLANRSTTSTSPKLVLSGNLNRAQFITEDSPS